MDSLSTPAISKSSSSQRYEGLDAFRGFAAFGVVWLHTFLAATANAMKPGTFTDDSVAWLKLRDFSLPLIVMSSFFVLTVSMLQKPESKFSSFFTTRFKRLWIPLFIWTIVYCWLWAFVMPEIFGWSYYRELSSNDVFISGYMHLWFLQFIFLGSLIVYPVLQWLRGKSERERIKISILFFFAAAVYAVIFKLSIQTIQENLVLTNPSQSLLIFTVQTCKYAFFVPVAVGLGLISSKITELYKSNTVRLCSLIAVLFTLIAHMILEYKSLTAPMYGIAVFLAALQPWKRIEFRLVYISAAYSYGIYILHYFLCEVLHVLVLKGEYKFNSLAIFSISVLFYVLSFGAAVLLRKIMPMDWFIPLVPIRIKKSEMER